MTKSLVLNNLITRAREILELHKLYPDVLPATTVKLLQRAIKPKKDSALHIDKLREAIRLAELHRSKFDAKLVENAEPSELMEMEVATETTQESEKDDHLVRLMKEGLTEHNTALRQQLLGYRGKVRRRDQAKFELFLAQLAAIKSAGSLRDLLSWNLRAWGLVYKYGGKSAMKMPSEVLEVRLAA